MATVVYLKARHALAFDRRLASQRVAFSDLAEVHLTRYQDRSSRMRRPIGALLR
ncbi:hypothetical protein [Variovorax sp. WS11]|uniref:hypothetical protein n=1 Tax=Variovorax sp. WS11 TaxID=1105204 RepID=UPI0013DB1F6F|nr:hypothetical protein [Variovorax sp. WS11]NDZ17614.1 hypothetical protein [Variovorax sp. WS11]